MIHSVEANQKSFRAVRFTPGVNLILADRSEGAGDKDTTNALGKSTLVDIIDFCLGSAPPPRKGVRAEALQDWAFTLEITLRGHRVRVTRSVASPSFIAIEGSANNWPVQPWLNKEGQSGLDLKQWRAVLGWALFGVGEKPSDASYAPSARSLLSYFTRNQQAAYASPFKHFDNQKTWDIQLHNAFLLGLDWEKAAQWQVLKDRKNALDALKQAIRTGAIDGELASVGELEAQRVQLGKRLAQESDALSRFQVLPQYREIENEANQLTAQIHQFVNANITDKRRIERYRDAMASEISPDDNRLEAMYSEAGVVLSSTIKRTLDDAREFNRAIIKNRQRFIADEVASLEARVEERTGKIAALTDRRAGLLNILANHGALEEFMGLQQKHAETKLRFDELTSRIAQLRQMTTRADQIKVDTVELKRSAELDYEERRVIWSRAVQLFADNSESLYNTPGRLVIDIDDTGYRYDVEIAGSPSEGISKMKIFCYDLMLISFARQQGLGINFLIHDSTIFDGVDPRQRAHALELATAKSAEHGFQYILTLNTDMLPIEDFSEGFDAERLVRLRLTDKEPSGSLLGFRY